MTAVALPERFWASIVPDENGCWVWCGSRYPDGYGQFWLGRALRAHRLSYEALVGPIPEGLVIDHHCENPPCVNPDHLEAVTHRENILRGTSMSAKHARKTHCKYGHELSGENLRDDGRTEWRICAPCESERRRRGHEAARAAMGGMTEKQRDVLLGLNLRAMQMADGHEVYETGVFSKEVAEAAGVTTRSAAVSLSKMRGLGWVQSVHSCEAVGWVLTEKGVAALEARRAVDAVLIDKETEDA